MDIIDKMEYLNKSRAASIKLAAELGTDLVEAIYVRGCCAECAKLRGRWFSISGKDKRFPKMPVDYGCTCFGLNFSAVFEFSSSISNGEEADMIAISNRPFVDDRTDYEKEVYEIHRKRYLNQLFWLQYESRWNAISQYDHDQYNLLTELMPDIAPKSYSGYMRMKKGNTKNYQNLVNIALSKGIFLDYPAEILIDIEILTPLRKKYIATITECNIREINLHKNGEQNK